MSDEGLMKKMDEILVVPPEPDFEDTKAKIESLSVEEQRRRHDRALILKHKGANLLIEFAVLMLEIQTDSLYIEMGYSSMTEYMTEKLSAFFSVAKGQKLLRTALTLGTGKSVELLLSK